MTSSSPSSAPAPLPSPSPSPASSRPRRPVALITGASRGIGRAIAPELARDHDLILGGRDAGALRELAEHLTVRLPAQLPDPGPALASAAHRIFAVDLTDPDAVARAVAQLDLPHGLDALVHSAGVLVSGTIAELTAQDWHRSLSHNVTAVADLTRLLLPPLRTARGTVVTINSGSGYTSGPGGAAYSASKFALRALTDALRAEERAHGVRVSSIHPGRVDTDMQHELRAAEHGDYRPEDYLRPADVAQAAALAVRAAPEASIDELSIRPRG